MTAKELVKELRKILKTRKGKDYPLYVWTGLGRDQTHVLEFVQLMESDDVPETDHIALQTTGVCQDLDHYEVGLVLGGKPELN